MFAKAAITGTLQAGGPTFTAEYLVVAGGGGGGSSVHNSHAGGGAGAGGYRSSVTGESSGGGTSAESALSIALGTPYTVTVGSGGSSVTSGNSSTFGSVVSTGGGHGGTLGNQAENGGSGGGAFTNPSTNTVGLGTSGQGFAGGSNTTSAAYRSGGGGGAGAVGTNGADQATAGNGGTGVASLITGASIYRAGGGGGGASNSALAGDGGLGGGGDGAETGAGAGSAGAVNTGGGGGGGGESSSGAGGAGGSGVVIIRVPSTVVAEFSAGVVYNYIPLDDFNVYEITAAGVSDTVTFSQGAVTTVGESLRFNDNDFAYLARTPSVTGDRKTWTWSGWVKRGNLGTIQSLLHAGTGSFPNDIIGILNDDRLWFRAVIGAATNWRISTAKFRDPSAWYHIVFVFDSNNPDAQKRARFYVNGKEITDWDTNATVPLGGDAGINWTTPHNIGRQQAGTYYLDGYLSDVYLIDGEALDPSRFGKQDADGIWQPISYTGSYGTNGFHLEFADNSTAAALGTDTSGNGNNWTPSGITTDDQVTDTPSVNYATLNPLDNNGTLSDGNLKVVTAVSATAITKATFAIPQSGKWYFEVLAGSSNGYIYIGDGAPNVANSVVYRGLNGDKRIDGTFSSYGASYTSGDLIGVAVNVDDDEINFYKNNVDQGTISYTIAGKTLFPAISDDSSSLSFTATTNFGQRPFAYTPPTGFQALNSSNLPAPTITDGKEHFQPVLYTGNGTSQTVRGLEFQPDFVWIKSRSNAFPHALYDAVRGVSKRLQSSTTSAESSPVSGVQSFESNGFAVGSDASGNSSGATFVAWTWNAGGSTVTNTDGTITSQVRANTDAGISIVSYTGTGAAATVGHGLTTAPAFIIAKNRDASTSWAVYSDELGISEYLLLSGTNAAATSTTVWNGTRPTASVFSVSTSNATNGSSNALIAYCFAEVDGFSKFGSYTGNGSADGPFVYTGFRPAFVMIKVTTVAGYHWYMKDTTRSPYNEATQVLYANLSNAEATVDADIDFVSNGFKVRDTGGINFGTNTYIFMAFAENPFKTARAR